MNEATDVDPQFVEALRQFKDRSARWIEAGRRGYERSLLLRKLLEAARNTQLKERLSDYFQACVQASGLSVPEASEALGVDLHRGFGIFDEPTHATLVAADALELPRDYVSKALQIACLESNFNVVLQPSDLNLTSEELALGSGARAEASFVVSSVKPFIARLSARLDALTQDISVEQKERLESLRRNLVDFYE